VADLVFYEKPGCINNTRQKKTLVDAGHKVDARNLIDERWDAVELRRYFRDLPLSSWFNQSAPQVKSGAIEPGLMTEESAIDLMIIYPLLIRRPLIRVGEEYRVGFDPVIIDEWIGLMEMTGKRDMETCPRNKDE